MTAFDACFCRAPHVRHTCVLDSAGKTWVLIATDLIGRGMDFVGINTVINYDFPRTTADYVHRIGRTGRAGHTGERLGDQQPTPSSGIMRIPVY